jgi:DNA polymerase IV
MKNRVIFHIDVNSAYLSWEAVYRLQHGEQIDLREVPAIVGGNQETRHGIVLAKSIPTKKFGILTGETLMEARAKCSNLIVVPPRYSIYMQASTALHQILQEYTPHIQRFSVDECFLDFTGMENLYGADCVALAEAIKERVKEELGFTVNIGISSNKLLAKVASDFLKPNNVHTLFPWEIKDKMWPLAVGDLFMVGRATEKKLRKLGITTIGDLAKANVELLKYHLKSHGILVWNYANGLENSSVRKNNYLAMKGIGNSTTIAFDVDKRQTAHQVILSLAETVGMRLRASENNCRVVAVSIKNNQFISYSRQRKLYNPINSTRQIAEVSCGLFDEVWQGEPIRHLGVHVSELCSNEFHQAALFDQHNLDKLKAVDKTIDAIRMKFGPNSIVRSVFINSDVQPLNGGIGEDDYPMMTSIL